MSGAIPPASWPSTKRAICLEYPDTVEWTALVSGVIELLAFGYYWNKDYANWEDARAEGMAIYQSWIAQIRCDAGAIPVQEPQCVDYPNNSPMLDWEPANPFTAPGEVPPGYLVQPWGVVGNPPVFTYQPGDVISGLFGLPVLTPALGQGLARVRIKFAGTGTVEVHLIKVLLGGLALLTWDDNPLTATFVDTSMDYLALPPESGDTDIQEITFDTPGNHHIDVTMLPRFAAEVGFAGYGGGIRKVVLCGPDLQAVDAPPESGLVDQFPGPDAPGGGETVAICDVIRWNNGQLEVWCCNEWQPAPQIGTGAPGIPTQPPPSSPPALGECFTYNVSLNAKDQWLLPFPINEGDTIQIISPTGGWNDGTTEWDCPTGQVYLLGICGGAHVASGTDPLPTGANHMQIVGNISGATGFFNPLLGVYTVPVGVTNEQLTLQANDDTLADNQGTAQFTLKVCSQTVETWCYEWNTTAERGPFAPLNDSGQSFGLWFSGTGWTNPSWVGGAQLTMLPTFDTTGCTHIEFDVTVGIPIVAPDHLDIYDQNGTNTLQNVTPLTAGAMTITYDGPDTVGQIWLNAFNFEADPGILTMTRIKMSGHGAPPLGPSTC